jgi:hypothetical protein
MRPRRKHIYLNQPWRLRLNLDPIGDGITSTELATASTISILYKKPISTSWVTKTATHIIGTSKIYVDFTNIENDSLGNWAFMAEVVFGGFTGSVPSKVVYQLIEVRGE